jgi:hypothetical protein
MNYPEASFEELNPLKSKPDIKTFSEGFNVRDQNPDS